MNPVPCASSLAVLRSSLALPQEGELCSLFQFLPSSLVVPWDLFNKVNPEQRTVLAPWQFPKKVNSIPCFSSFPVSLQFLGSSLALLQEGEPSSLGVTWVLFNKVNPFPCSRSLAVPLEFLGSSSRR